MGKPLSNERKGVHAMFLFVIGMIILLAAIGAIVLGIKDRKA